MPHMPDASRGSLPSKLYFRIGEVAELVGVEPHVLRYWEREFRTIRPTKSAKGQRVYSRRDVENLMRVRELLYREGFTIAGAKKKLVRTSEEVEAALEANASKAREELAAMRAEIESFLEELGPVAPSDRSKK
jgi:DNA-binding transcriptional MerR regulator